MLPRFSRRDRDGKHRRLWRPRGHCHGPRTATAACEAAEVMGPPVGQSGFRGRRVQGQGSATGNAVAET